MARPDQYEEKVKPHLNKITEWAFDGDTNKQIFTRLEITEPTFTKYRKQHKELREALAEGRSYSDHVVENSLYKRANGYETIEVHTTKSPEGTTVKTVVKWVAPDPTSMIFWLKNRKNSWSDKKLVEISGSLDLEKLTDEELLLKLDKLKAGNESGNG